MFVLVRTRHSEALVQDYRTGRLRFAGRLLRTILTVSGKIIVLASSGPPKTILMYLLNSVPGTAVLGPSVEPVNYSVPCGYLISPRPLTAALLRETPKQKHARPLWEVPELGRVVVPLFLKMKSPHCLSEEDARARIQEGIQSVKKQFPHQMEKESGRGEKTGNARRGWNEGRKKYRCSDKVNVIVMSRVFEPSQQGNGFRKRRRTAPMNTIVYCIGRRLGPQLFVTGTEFDRSMSQLAYGAEYIRTVTFPGTVRDVKCNVFAGNSSLRSAVLNEGLEQLGGYEDQYLKYTGVFQNSRLQQVTVPSTLVALNDNTFQGCKQLSRVTSRQKTQITEANSREWEVCHGEAALPDALEETSSHVFYDCPKIKTIWVGNSSIADSLGQYSRQTIFLARSTMVGDQLLWDLRRVKNVVIPEGVQEIGERWFKNSKIKSVTISTSVTVIEKEAFCHCNDLKCVTFTKRSQLERIGDYCFQFSRIEEIQLPSTLRKIGKNTFESCRSLKTIYVEDGCETRLINACVPNSTNIIPISTALIGGMSIQDLRKMKDVAIPEGTKRIGNYWFWRSGIESVTVPASVKEISVEAFYRCKNLKQIAFTEGSRLEKIGPESFCESGMERIIIPKGVEEIEDSAFEDCGYLKEVVFEAGSALKKIGNYAFQNCASLRNIQLPDGLEIIGKCCFYNSGLEEIVLPISVKEVRARAFSLCTQLKSVQLNEGLEELGNSTFYESAIENITLPSTLKRIERTTFSWCKNLKRIEIPNGVEYVGENCFCFSEVEEITLPSTLKGISGGAFDCCSNLRTVFVEDGCTLDVRQYMGNNVKVKYK